MMEIEAAKAEMRLREQQEFNRRLEMVQSVYEQQGRVRQVGNSSSSRLGRDNDDEDKHELQRQLDKHAVSKSLQYIVHVRQRLCGDILCYHGDCIDTGGDKQVEAPNDVADARA
jgi:hypothetical protein